MPLKPAIRAGTVVSVFAKTSDGATRSKRYVVMHIADEYIACIINSQPTEFALSKDAIRRCQVAIEAGDYPGMDHSAFVDCSRVFQLDIDDVLAQIDLERWRHHGAISRPLAERIIGALTVAPTIAPRRAAELCASLRAAFDDVG